jgi:lipopolysaccharide biosynthesis glycosyltransferase
MAVCCIAYTSDPAYLFPSLASACQARAHASSDLADVIIFGFGLDASTLDLFSPRCASEHITLLPIAWEAIEGAPSMHARLFLNRFVPPQYTRYLYMDGDVQITGSLDPLIQIHVPPCRFLAANDPLTFQIDDVSAQSRSLARHLQSLGFAESQAHLYFNSGVLRICRSGWQDIGEGAWEQLRKMKDPARFPDQDALNLVAGERRLPMSLIWNFPIFLRNSRLASAIQPRVQHFMSNPKPWQGCFAPWTSAECEPYRRLLHKYPSLLPIGPRMSAARKAAYHLHQQRKRVIETLSWGFSTRRTRILRYESTCAI